jgi:hypothetical protein
VNLLGYWEVLNSQRRVVAIGIAARNGFLPSGGLIAQQSDLGDSAESGGRITDLAPSLEEWERKPLLGSGMRTRITVGENANGRLLDDQWLGLLIDTAAGVLAVACTSRARSERPESDRFPSYAARRSTPAMR